MLGFGGPWRRLGGGDARGGEVGQAKRMYPLLQKHMKTNVVALNSVRFRSVFIPSSCSTWAGLLAISFSSFYAMFSGFMALAPFYFV